MTTASEIVAAANRKPRQLPAPSQRNQQIYLDYQTGAMRQSELAEKYELTQCRISQIIRRVERWLNAAADSDSNIAGDAAARQNLEQRLQNARLTEVSRLAMRHFHDQQKTITHKKGTRGGKDIDETTERLLPPNVQCLKVVLQATTQLSRLEKEGSTSVPPRADATAGLPSSAPQTDDSTDAQKIDDQSTADAGREYVEHWLTQHREAAQPTVLTSRGCDSQTVVHDLVSALLGQANDGWGLLTLADESGKKIVDRKPYDHDPPKLQPNHNGWYYPMHDGHGALVAWLSAEQIKGAVHPDYAAVYVSGLTAQSADGCASARSAENPSSTTSSPTANSPQTAGATTLSPATFALNSEKRIGAPTLKDMSGAA